MKECLVINITKRPKKFRTIIYFGCYRANVSTTVGALRRLRYAYTTQVIKTILMKCSTTNLSISIMCGWE